MRWNLILSQEHQLGMYECVLFVLVSHVTNTQKTLTLLLLLFWVWLAILSRVSGQLESVKASLTQFPIPPTQTLIHRYQNLSRLCLAVHAVLT